MNSNFSGDKGVRKKIAEVKAARDLVGKPVPSVPTRTSHEQTSIEFPLLRTVVKSNSFSNLFPENKNSTRDLESMLLIYDIHDFVSFLESSYAYQTSVGEETKPMNLHCEGLFERILLQLRRDKSNQSEDDDGNNVVKATIELLRSLADVSTDEGMGMKLGSHRDILQFLLQVLHSFNDNDAIFLYTLGALTNLTYYSCQVSSVRISRSHSL
jgi:hypothetical protein